MSGKVTPVIAEGTDCHIYLAAPDPQGPFPAKIYAHASFVNDNSPVMYVPRIFAKHIVVMEDDDNIVGHSYCSKCEKNVNMFDKYCRHCGARLNEKKFLGETND